jgi:MoxR-like ATPase
MKSIVREVPIASHVKDYAIRLVLSSHPDKGTRIKAVQDYVRYGASPRGAQSLILASKVMALLTGRYHVSLDDIRSIAKPSLRHRIILNLRGEAEGIDVDHILSDLMAGVPEKTRA